MTNNFFTTVLFLLICFQVAGQRATRQSAQEAFNRGDYRKAYSEFSELLEVYSRDPLYKYYASVCLIKLEQDPEQAERLIKEAFENNSAARVIPSDATFYLARALQMNGNFTEAIAVYQRFAGQAGRRAARDFGVQAYVQQCSRGEGALAKTQPETQIATECEITNTAAVPLFITPPEVVVAQETIPILEPLAGDYSDMLDKALYFQFSADSIRQVNAAIDNLPNDQRAEARTIRAENERLAASYQNSANEMFAAAQKLIVSPAEEVKTQTEEIVTVSVETQDIYYYFEILENPSSEAVQIDPDIPEGLNYRIQIAVFRNPVVPAFFKGITPVYGVTNANNPELKTYYAGMFRRLSDARAALEKVKNKGFNDSFIAFFSGDIAVSANRAAALEQEWRTRPFERLAINSTITLDNQTSVVTHTPVAVVDDNSPAPVTADALLPTLFFRVEVMRGARAAAPAVVESLKTLAGNRGLDIITTDDRMIAYIIGNFITYNSAAEYADLLVRNGYRDTKVIAWLANREIPLETARQLFDSLE